MFDIKWIRDNAETFDEGLRRRGLEPGVNVASAQEIVDLDNELKSTRTELQSLLERRKSTSNDVGKAKKAGQEELASMLSRSVGMMKNAIAEGEERERQLEAKIKSKLEVIPNIPSADVPFGTDETGNVEVRKVGTPRTFPFAPKQHFEIGEALGLMDFEAAQKISGARFVVLKGALARLERAIASFMLDLHTGEFGYTEVNPPLLVKDQAAYGTGNLPKFAEDLFRTTNDFWLIPTAEISLTNLAREQIIDEAQLPMRMTAWTPCFRSEAGAAGRDTRGMIRQHQFSKVELVSIVTPEAALEEHKRMTSCAEEVLKRLGLPFRTMLLCTGDMGFASQKTYDIEVWLPGQNAYREISSCSVCGDFQARRMGARYRPSGVQPGAFIEKPTRVGDKTFLARPKSPEYVHTLNGSGLAVGRTLIAVLENYQQADGIVVIPDALRPYMGGLAQIQKA